MSGLGSVQEPAFEQIKWETDTTENIIFTTALAGGKYFVLDFFYSCAVGAK